MQGSLPSRAFNRLVDPSYTRFEKRLVELQGTRLTRLNIQPVKNAINVFFARRLTFASLEHLFISNYESEGTWNRLQWPEMPRLRSLSLFLCGFSDVHVPLPSSCRLRALEIVGGYFHTDQLWKEIVSAGESLELLTFAPAYSSSIPYLAQHLHRLVASRIYKLRYVYTSLQLMILPSAATTRITSPCNTLSGCTID